MESLGEPRRIGDAVVLGELDPAKLSSVAGNGIALNIANLDLKAYVERRLVVE